jgi:Domain of unknown function (DU1801)
VSDVDTFLAAKVAGERLADARALIELMSAASGEPAAMYGSSIIGFGSYHYRYESGREGDAPLVGFAPRAKEFALYVNAEVAARQADLEALGPHRRGKGCLYVRRLAEVDLGALRRIIGDAVRSHGGPQR